MTHKFLADLMTAVHFLWILFNLVSLPLLFLITWWSWVTLIFAGITILPWPFFHGCWFFQLENKYRNQHNPKEVLEGKTFIQHYLKKYFNISIPRSGLRIAIYGYMALLIGIAIIKIL